MFHFLQGFIKLLIMQSLLSLIWIMKNKVAFIVRQPLAATGSLDREIQRNAFRSSTAFLCWKKRVGWSLHHVSSWLGWMPGCPQGGSFPREAPKHSRGIISPIWPGNTSICIAEERKECATITIQEQNTHKQNDGWEWWKSSQLSAYMMFMQIKLAFWRLTWPIIQNVKSSKWK